jgi:hypothetical protein
MATPALDRIRAEADRQGEGLVARLARARPVGVGWATVESDRAVVELAAELRVSIGAFELATGSAALGASALIGRGWLPGGPSIAIVEPDTEGRLAAALARHGEGPLAVWLAPEDTRVALDALRTAGIVTSSEGPGPFGPERFVLDGPTYGPHTFLVGSAAGTIPA